MRYGDRPAHRAIILLALLAIALFAALLAPGTARAQATCQGGGTFAAIGDSLTVDISSCSTFFTNTLQDHSTERWGGLTNSSGALVRGPANCGVGSVNTASGCTPSAQTITTSNATYSYSADLINGGLVTVKLLTVTNAAATSDTSTMYTYVGDPEVKIADSASNTAFKFSFTLPVSTLAPTVTGIAPNTGPVAGGTSVTLTGTNLAGATSVTFGGTAAAITSNTATSLVVTAPAHAVGAVTVAVTTAGGNTSASFTYTAAPLVVSPAAGALAAGTVGTPYSQTFSITGGTAPYSVSMTGALPDGLAFDASTLKLSGTPTPAASASNAFSLNVGDAAGATATLAYTLAITSNPPVANPVAANVAAGAGASAIVIDVTGGAPSRVDIATQARHGVAAASGTSITYTPAAGYTGSDTFTYTATNAFGTSPPATVTVNVAAGILVLSPGPGALPAATVGTAYRQALSVTGGTAPYQYAVSGELPPGLALSNGAITGTPTAAVAASFTVVATDAAGIKGQAAYTLATTGPVPAGLSRSMQVVAGTTVTVDLAAGATGGPFSGAALVDPPPASEGRAVLRNGNGAFLMSFTAAPLAAGSVVVRYTLSNAWQTSVPAAITFTVVARPDPSKDTEVIGLVNAQVQTAQRFATTQISNFGSRLEQLHDERTRQADAFGIRFGAPSASQPDRRGADGSSAAGSPLAQAFGAVPASALPSLKGAPADESGRSGTSRESGSAGGGGSPSSAGRPRLAGPLAVWTGGFVNFGSSDKNSIKLDHTLVGVSGGADYRLSPDFVAGVGFGYGHERNDVGGNGTQVKGQAVSVALYGSYHPAPIFVDGLLGYSHLDFDSRRYVTTTGGQADGDRGGAQIFGSLSAGYEYRDADLLVSPYGRFQAAWTRLDTFTEEGADVWNLTYGRQEFSMLAGVAGLRTEYVVPTSWGALAYSARFEYTHDFAGSSRARVGYADTGITPYGLNVAGLSQNTVSAQLGVETQLRRNLAIGLSYQGSFGFERNALDHAFMVKFRTRF
ncbi:autotransporter domain-containing protein [Bordetella sp. LUAb4]|uniref:autotransporter family protein n=1 Tax=Bordetella sp. LUAb4 TaxID=2843195 RepID=UPI001E5B8CB9|nr:autotransporter domain-containing protein [Bordetella sp. LUAb4]